MINTKGLNFNPTYNQILITGKKKAQIMTEDVIFLALFKHDCINEKII
jgi:hypothetical protein